MAKLMLHRAEARAALGRGVGKLALAVGGTLGPKGMNVIIDRPIGTPIVSRDGVSIAEEIELPCRFEDLGVRVVREVARQTNELAGDGTTTATVLADALIQEGLRIIEGPVRPVDVADGIEQAALAVIEHLRTHARPARGRAPLEAVATLAANDRALGRLVAEAVDRVGPDGIVTVDFGATHEDELRITEGMAFDRGYHSRHMATDVETMRAVLDEPLVLLTDRRIESADELDAALELAQGLARPLLLVADEVAPEAVQALLAFRRDGRGIAVAVHPPEFGHWRQAMLEDLAIITGGRVIARDLGGRLEAVTQEDLGSAGRAIVGQAETTLLKGGGAADAVRARRAQVQRQLEMAPPNIEHDKLEERLAKLTGGTAVIMAGGATPAEQKRRVQLLDDAVAATRAAAAEGVLPGGGAALLQAAPRLDALAERSEGGVREGVRLFQRALATPLRRIAENAGFDGEEIVARVAAAQDGTGLDARSGRLVDLVEASILDPVRVTTTAVRNAASAAVLILSSHTLIVDEPEATDPTAGPARGGGAEKLGRQ